MGTTSGHGLVLVVEDEPAIAGLLRRYLAAAGFGVHTEATASGALAAVRRLRPAAVILDVALGPRPDPHEPGDASAPVDGLAVCRALRAEDDWTPIIFATARTEERDRLVGLESGADDYVTKPFSPREVVARVKAVLRRADARAGAPDRTLTAGAVRLSPESRSVTVHGVPREFTPTEFNLLRVLMAHPGRAYERAELLALAWGQADYGASRTVDVHVAQLRAKLGSDCPIETVRGHGYRLATPDQVDG